MKGDDDKIYEPNWEIETTAGLTYMNGLIPYYLYIPTRL